MEKINQILIAIVARRNELREEDEALRKLEEIYSNNKPNNFRDYQKLEEVKSTSEIQTSEPSQTKIELMTKYHGYPFTGTLEDKLCFLDIKEERGFSSYQRKCLISVIEGESAHKTIAQFSTVLTKMVLKGTYIRGNFSNYNKFGFYYKPEWLTASGNDSFDILPSFLPLQEDLERVPEKVRGFENIKWYTSENLKI